jgi:hypothetical protein
MYVCMYVYVFMCACTHTCVCTYIRIIDEEAVVVVNLKKNETGTLIWLNQEPFQPPPSAE